jgi:hypothetical protein
MVCGPDCLLSVAQGKPVDGVTVQPSRYGPPLVQVRSAISGDLFPSRQPVFHRAPLFTVSSLRVERPSVPLPVDGM